MTKISATIVADSKSPSGDRLTSMLVTFPRFILAELNTHRMLSKNSASSRAIPFNTMVKSVQDNPFIPIAWQKEHKGMQGTEYITDNLSVQFATSNWLTARDNAIKIAESLHSTENGYGSVTKQLCNRLLEPFMWHTVLISGTEWENFFSLRCPQYQYQGSTIFKSKKELIAFFPEIQDFTDLQWLQHNKGQAEIHMMALAEAMWDAMNESTPKLLRRGEWHTPFKNNINSSIVYHNIAGKENGTYEKCIIKISSAMCARVSYTVVGDEKEFSYEKQIELHDRMANAVPFHASPFEHCARVMTDIEYQHNIKGNLADIENNLGWCRNYRGFIQYREILENGNITK